MEFFPALQTRYYINALQARFTAVATPLQRTATTVVPFFIDCASDLSNGKMIVVK